MWSSQSYADIDQELQVMFITSIKIGKNRICSMVDVSWRAVNQEQESVAIIYVSETQIKKWSPDVQFPWICSHDSLSIQRPFAVAAHPNQGLMSCVWGSELVFCSPWCKDWFLPAPFCVKYFHEIKSFRNTQISSLCQQLSNTTWSS